MSRTTTSPCCDDVEAEGEEKFHPFIQAELETLNKATQQVNTLEARLEETRILFIEVNKERTNKLDELVKKLGKCVEKARPYYEAKARQKALQTDVQRAAQMYERACSTVEAAKEMVHLAEQSIINIGTLDGNWQEVLNHATERVLKAEREKEDSEQVHRIHAEELVKVAQSCMSLERSVKNCITKSAAYFELLQSYNDKLEVKKQEIRDLETSLQSAKQTYSLALSTLENISNIIHQRRQALREKRLHRSTDGADDKEDPLLLDVPDLIRQLSVSSSPRHESYQQENTSSLLPPSTLLTTVHTSQSSTAVNTAVHTGSPFSFSSSSPRPVPAPLKPNAMSCSDLSQVVTPPASAPPFRRRSRGAIRAGVVISASDLLRSIGLVHLADTMPQQQQQQSHNAQQQQHQSQNHLPQYMRPAGGKGLTSSSSSYSLPTSAHSLTTTTTTTSTLHTSDTLHAQTRIHQRPHQVSGHTKAAHSLASTPLSTDGNPNSHSSSSSNSNPIAVSCPSPSLSDISTASSTTAGSHRRIFSMHHDHSGRSSETEDLPGNGEDVSSANSNNGSNNNNSDNNNNNNNNNDNKKANPSAINSSIMSVTPVSIDAVTSTLNVSPQSDTPEAP